jgi:hypothetical protein
MCAALITAAAVVRVGVEDDRVAALCFIENIRAESLRVVGTYQPEGDLRIDCDVE